MTTTINEKGLSRIDKLVDMLQQKIYAEFPIQQLKLLAKVAEHAKTGVTMPELMALTKMPQGSLSRNIKKLSTYLEPDEDNPNIKKEGGYGLVRTVPDMVNRRSFRVFITKKGEKLVEKLAEVVSED